jgi:transketolase
MATGSEVSLVVEAHKQLTAAGIRARVVSLPSWELFERQPQTYKDQVLPPSVTARVAVETGSPFGWERHVGCKGAIIGLNRFGASAPAKIVLKELGFSVENVVAKARAVLEQSRRA